jgi:hypothetical protein
MSTSVFCVNDFSELFNNIVRNLENSGQDPESILIEFDITVHFENSPDFLMRVTGDTITLINNGKILAHGSYEDWENSGY